MLNFKEYSDTEIKEFVERWTGNTLKDNAWSLEGLDPREIILEREAIKRLYLRSFWDTNRLYL